MTTDAEVVPEGAEHSVPADRPCPYFGPATRRVAVLFDRVPPGEVEIRRHEHVLAVDEAIRHVEGLALDDAGHVTHVPLWDGHPSGPTEVAIPVASLAGIDRDGIHLRLSKREIADLPEGGRRRRIRCANRDKGAFGDGVVPRVAERVAGAMGTVQFVIGSTLVIAG